MSRKLVMLVVPLMLVAWVGCQQPAKTDGCAKCPLAQKAAAKSDDSSSGGCCASAKKADTCPLSAAKSEGCAKGSWCNKCQKVHGVEGTVHCDKCGKDFAAGTYCATCNRIMLPGTVKCEKCNKELPKGAYCPGCKKYLGVEGVAYCEHCKKPYNVKQGCPGCKPAKS